MYVLKEPLLYNVNVIFLEISKRYVSNSTEPHILQKPRSLIHENSFLVHLTNTSYHHSSIFTNSTGNKQAFLGITLVTNEV